MTATNPETNSPRLTLTFVCKKLKALSFLIGFLCLNSTIVLGQIQIFQSGVNVTGTTITSCGNSSITLTAGSTASPLTWNSQKLTTSTGNGSLSLSSGTGSTQTFTPTISGVDAYRVTLTDSANSSASVILVFAPIPNISALNIPISLCENDGPQIITTGLASNQTLSASAGTLSSSGSTVTLDPQGIANGTAITLTLTETNTIPGGTSTFNCSSSKQIYSFSPNLSALNLPVSLCENGGYQLVTSSLGPNQTLTASAGILNTSGSTVTLDPQGLSDNTTITLTLKETFTVPSSTATIDCEITAQITTYTPSTASFTLSQNSFQKCESPYNLPSGIPSGGTYIVNGFPNAINAQGQLDPSVLPEGTYQLTYTAVDANGCTTSTSQSFSITGLNYTGSTADILIFTTGNPFGNSPPLNPILSSGVYSFAECITAVTTAFSLYFANHSLNFHTYSFDWDDGSTSTGIVPTSITNPTPITHLYNAAGTYNVSLTLNDTVNSCSINSNFVLFFGSTPSVTLKPNQNDTYCLGPNDSQIVDTEILSWENDIAGTSYTFSSNDGTSFSATAPLMTNGTPNFPFLKTDSSGTSLFYSHVFSSSSCGAFSAITGANAYQIQCSKSNLCATKNAIVEPVIISSSPKARLHKDTAVCTETNIVIEDRSFNGNLIKPITTPVGSITQYSCDSSTAGVWEIYDDQWNLITLSSGVISLATGSTTGDFGFFNANKLAPWNWNLGSKDLEISFSSVGKYHLIKYVGTAENSSLYTGPNAAYCYIDQDTVDICVDTIPIVQVAEYFPDFVCLNSTISTSVFEDSVNCFDSTLYRFTVYNSSNSIVSQSSSSTDTTYSWTPTMPGLHYIEYEASNDCGSTSIRDTFYVIGASFSSESSSCAPWTTYPVPDTISNLLSYSWSITPNGSFTSLATLTGANSSNPTLSFSDLQYPDADQDYTLTLTMVGPDSCTISSSQPLTLYARPNADFTVPADACGPVTLAPSAGTDYGSNGTVNVWNWTVTDSSAFTLTSTQQNPSFTLPTSTNGSVTYTVQQIVTDDRGCIDTAAQNFSILPTPTASFTLTDSICTNSNINALTSNNSNPNDGTTQLSYAWNIDTAGSVLYSDTNQVPNYLLLNTTNAAITYNISLTVTNTDGCDSTVSDSIIVFPNAIAQLDSLATLNNCAPFIIDSSLISASHYPNNGSYTWEITTTNGIMLTTNSGRQSVNYTLNNSKDSVWVKLTVNSNQGCLPDKDSILVYTLPNPNPYFKLENDTGCTAFIPVLDSLSQSNGLHKWKVFDSSLNQIGITLLGNNPTFPTLLNGGSAGLTSYFIEHTIFQTDSLSCDSTYTSQVYVSPLSIPSISPIATYCSRDSIRLFGTSTNDTNVNSWVWSVGNDSVFGQNPTYYNNTPGDYIVTLTTTTKAGCDTSTYDTLTIHSYPVANGYINNCGRDTVCVNQNFNFYDSSATYLYGGSLISYSWDFDDDGSIEYNSADGTHSFSSTGIKPVRLTVSNEFGCVDDTLINIYVNAAPENSFEILETDICGPDVFNISVSDTGVVDSSFYELYALDNGLKVILQTWNSTPTSFPLLQPNYIGDTTYYMSRALFNCCGSTSVFDSIVVKTPPVADFVILPDSGCTPLNTILQFDGLIGGQADSAFIDFGDGNFLTMKPNILQQGSNFIYQWGQVNHTFTYSGNFDTTYLVTLSVFNNCGDSSLTLPVYLEPNAVQAAFGIDKSSGCSPLTVNFTNYSYNTTSTAWCFDWDVASNSCNGGGSVNQNPTWTFTQPGTYTVALLVDNGCGYDTAFQNVTVFPSPVAVISSNNNVCANDSVNFISNSTTSAGFIAGHLWEFGNGDTSILQNVDYLYDTSGVYAVTLTVTTSTGCSDSVGSLINIRPTPDVNFTTQNVCLNDTTFFENLTTLSNGQIIGNAWNFGDGNSSNAFEPYHIYNAPGTYQVTLTHTSDYGCIDSSQQIAIVHDLPQLSFTPSLINGDSCSVPQTYLFTNNSTNGIQYNWDFDYANNPGVNTSTLTNPTFNYTSAGIYTVALFAETAFGCIDSLFTNILVRDGVNARHVINPTEGCEPLDVTFADTSIYTSSLDTIVSVEWFFGNGNSFIQTTAPFVYNYRYDNYGTYAVYNVVTMASGCLDTSAQTTINVYPTPDADFTISQVNIDTRTFVNLTSFVDSSITYYWTFSDGQTSTDVSPTVRFEPSTSGLDSIKACLYVINSFGCADSICKSFWVWPTNLIVPNAFAPDLNYIGEDALFLPKGHSLKEYEIWIYDQWGSVVWYSNKIDPDIKSPAEGWDGKHMDSGEPLPMGVYAWRIRALFDNDVLWIGQDNTHGFQKAYGTLTLIR